MAYTKFISQLGWFSLDIPTDWAEYDDGEEGTYAFFNTKSKSWTGNFRITNLKCSPTQSSEKDFASHYIEGHQKSNPGPVKIKLGKFDCVHYKKDVVGDKEKFVMYYWTTAKENKLFICSFTIDKTQENTPINKRELKTVQKIIASLEVR
jgi:hypothetical protein